MLIVRLMLNPIEAPSLSDLAGIRHGFFTRDGGVSEGIYSGLNCGLGSSDEPARVLENRARVARHLGAAHNGVTTLYQVHGAAAHVVKAPIPRADLPKADAVVTNTPGLAIGVLTADCTPVLFADPEAKVVAAAHAGWRGAVSGVLESAIAAMEGLGARRANIRAAVGPSISPANYEVGPQFMADMLTIDPAARHRFYRPAAAAREHFDLPGYVKDRLGRAGIGCIEAAAPCTFENESRFFSFRRSQARKEGDYGRQISAIVVA